MNPTVDRIIEEAKALPESERQMVISELQKLAALNLTREQQFAQSLAAEGFLTLPEPLPPGAPPFELAPLLEVKGAVASEVLIHERR